MKINFFIIFLFLVFQAEARAFEIMNVWRHPEIAEKNSVFADAGVPIMFEEPHFSVLPVDLRADYMLPLPYPFSAGIFLKTPNPNLKSFGVRFGYHFDVFDPLTDVYVVWSFNCGFILTDVLAYYNDSPAPVHFFDFRAGFRRFITPWLGVCVETGFKLESVCISLSFKLN
jgi:hypothetical protein